MELDNLDNLLSTQLGVCQKHTFEPPPQPCWLYVITTTEWTGRCKIGISRNVAERCEQLNQGSCYSLKVVCSVRMCCAVEARRVESYMHNCLASKLVPNLSSREWFNLSREELDHLVNTLLSLSSEGGLDCTFIGQSISVPQWEELTCLFVLRGGSVNSKPRRIIQPLIRLGLVVGDKITEDGCKLVRWKLKQGLDIEVKEIRRECELECWSCGSIVRVGIGDLYGSVNLKYLCPCMSCCRNIGTWAKEFEVCSDCAEARDYIITPWNCDGIRMDHHLHFGLHVEAVCSALRRLESGIIGLS